VLSPEQVRHLYEAIESLEEVQSIREVTALMTSVSPVR
jgi:hypothetical protein